MVIAASSGAALRPTITGTRQMVASGHYLATLAGHAMLEAGGNAVDAGCAAGIALGVLQSDIVNVAGVAPILMRMTDSPDVVSIAGLGWWPAALDPAVFMNRHGGKLPIGVLRTVVPSAPDAWLTALSRFGTMRFADIVEPAIRYARDGFHMHALMAQTLREKAEDYGRWESTRDIYLPSGNPPNTGDLFVQSDLAATLQYMADEERAAGGDLRTGYEAARSAFYLGDIARKIVDHQQANGGLLAMEDLAAYRSEVGNAVERRFGAYSVHTCDAWCQGPTLLQALKMVENSNLKHLPRNGADYIHLLTEILKIAFRDRERFYGDPRFVDVPLQTLLSDKYAAECIAGIDPAKASDAGRANLVPEPGTEPDTSYVSVADRWGNTFSATPSDGSWHAPVVPGTGLVPSCRGTQSRLDPDHPAGLAPGKRPRLTPSPALAVADDGSVIAFGTPGGDVQIQAMLQVFLNLSLFSMDLQAAIEAPRFATYSFPSSFYPYEDRPQLLKLESRLDPGLDGDLLNRGHKVERWPDYSWLAGGVCAVVSGKAGYFGGADPRRPSYAIGW
ncbi:gamma-glutamyltransferase family protein [Aquamicrobium soli]|jgi:gamma-glutamyltranspeptidase/glutathione hydrolase|uniref:Gamma-glutamyltransferase family protein n=1 Tax=Aquamicrobium soli TaxID=1811518 RepID=A0ABV7K5T4_9HYPH